LFYFFLPINIKLIFYSLFFEKSRASKEARLLF